MKILISGATGLLGKAFLNLLQQESDVQVYAFARNKHYKNFSNIQWIQFDFFDLPEYSSLPKEVDVIIHLAQSEDYKEFPDKGMNIFKVNLYGTQYLLDYAIKANVKHFIFSSTGSVYENCEGICKEDIFCKPQSYYANSKLCAENLIMCYKNYFAVKVYRLFNLYGENGEGRFISNIVNPLKSNKLFFLPHNSLGSKTFPTHVEDVAKLVKETIKDGNCGIFNLSHPEDYSFKELVDLIARHLNIMPVYEYKNTPNENIVPCLEKISAVFDLKKFRSFKKEMLNFNV